MRVLVAGATSVPGLPLMRQLNARGHEVIGLTRQSAKTPQIEHAGAKPGLPTSSMPRTSTPWWLTSNPRW
jgi:nucleoside-diphosphate-sugar epimerase